MPKFWQKSGKLGKEKKYKKIISAFFWSYVPNPEVHAKPPIWENYTTLPETCLRVLFSNINNITENVSFQ